MSDVAAFIATYSAADEPRVRFDWNGLHAPEFVDRNFAFRSVVREAVLQDPAAAPLLLIRDLFRAETQYARAAWGVEEGLGVLAEQLLRRGGAENLDDYLEGKFSCFDAEMGSVFPADAELAEMLLAALRERLHSHPDSPRAELWRCGEALFAGWLRRV